MPVLSSYDSPEPSDNTSAQTQLITPDWSRELAEQLPQSQTNSRPAESQLAATSAQTPAEWAVPDRTQVLANLDDWFDDNSTKFDTNRNGNIEGSELQYPLIDSTVSSVDVAYLSVLNDNIHFFDSHDSQFGVEQRITPVAIDKFADWMKSEERDLAKLQATAPEDFAAVKYLQDNFTQLNPDGNLRITLDELDSAMARPELSLEESASLKLVRERFQAMDDLTLELGRRGIGNPFDVRGGVGAQELAMFMVDKSNPNSWAPFSRSWEDMTKINYYAALTEIRTSGDTFRGEVGDAPES